MKIVEVILRFGGAVMSLIAFTVMAATSETQTVVENTFKLKFNDFQAYSYLVAVNVISFIYSSWQLIVLGQSTKSSFLPFLDPELCLYICDQVQSLELRLIETKLMCLPGNV